MSNTSLQEIRKKLAPFNCQLVAVSKTKPVEMILNLYDQDQRHFGENRVQELVDKQAQLPSDIHWHFIGHLQTNKVKHIAPFVHLIHAVDSYKLLKEIDKRAKANNRVISVLLQFKIAQEEAKHGYSGKDIFAMLDNELLKSFNNIRIIGVMGMATFTDNTAQIEREFTALQVYFDKLKNNYFFEQESFKELSMGMSGDYAIALIHGSTMVRIGSLLFGNRA